MTWMKSICDSTRIKKRIYTFCIINIRINNENINKIKIHKIEKKTRVIISTWKSINYHDQNWLLKK